MPESESKAPRDVTDSQREVVSTQRVRCSGAEWKDERVSRLSLSVIGQVDALITTFSNSTTRVSCPYFDRNQEREPICRAGNETYVSERQLKVDELPFCIFAYDRPGDSEATLTDFSGADNDDDLEEEIDEEQSGEGVETEE
jgi:hypothetical protein